MTPTITPLSLSSPRWQTLKAHFGNAGQDSDEVPAVPKLIQRWLEAVGSYAEEYAYDLLHESYLHQGTILDVAYAVVPHLVKQLETLDMDRRVEVIDDCSLVEAVRLRPRDEVEKGVQAMATMPESLRDQFMQNVRDRNPLLPEDLSEAYLAAVANAKRIAGAAWDQLHSEPMGPHRWRRHVRFLREQGLTAPEIRQGIECLTREGDDGALVFLGIEAVRSGLIAAAGQGWIPLTKLSNGQGRLIPEALLALAWIERHAPIDRMLGSA
jgi:hypothetical protein